MRSPVRPELSTASVGSSQAPTAAVDNSAPFSNCPRSTYKSGKAVQTNGATSKFEEMLVGSGIKLLKYYLDISNDEQAKRLDERRRDPLKQWKSSPVDAVAVKHWKAYSAARDAMLMRTHTATAPWRIVRADNKRLARLNLMRDMLSRLHYAGRKDKLVRPDPDVVFEFSADCLEAGRLAR